MLCDAQLYLDRSQEELRLTAAVLSPLSTLIQAYRRASLRAEGDHKRCGLCMWAASHCNREELIWTLGCPLGHELK